MGNIRLGKKDIKVFLKALRTCRKVNDVKYLPWLTDTVLLSVNSQDIYAHKSNLSTWIRVSLTDTGLADLPGGRYLIKLKATIVYLSAVDSAEITTVCSRLHVNGWCISADGNEGDYPILEAEKYAPSNWYEDTGELLSEIAYAGSSVDARHERVTLQSVYIDGGNVVGTNGHRLSVGVCPMDNEGFFIHKNIVKKMSIILKGKGTVRYGIANGYLTISRGDTGIVIKDVAEGIYPKYENILSISSTAYKISLEDGIKARIISALEMHTIGHPATARAVQLSSSALYYGVDMDEHISLSTDTDTETDAEMETETETERVGLDAEYLKGTLMDIGGGYTYLYLQGAKMPVHITDDKGERKAVIMPINLELEHERLELEREKLELERKKLEEA